MRGADTSRGKDGQLALFVEKKRGGKRRGAGRPPKHERAGESHERRPFHDSQHPVHVVLRLTDAELFQCPFIMMTEPGGAYFDEDEAVALRGYLERGGFLWADDFWGDYAFNIWAREIGKALPPYKYPIVDLPISHPIFHLLYDLKRVPQIPSINFWAGTGGFTSERGERSAVPHVRAIFDENERMIVLMTHNTDFGDAFEREGDDHQYFLAFAPEGYAFGVNALLYALTH